MANDIPDLNSDPPEDGGSRSRAVARWMNTSRYVALMSLFAEQKDGPGATAAPSRVPLKRRLTDEDRDALVNAGLILLVIAILAFVAGLL